MIPVLEWLSRLASTSTTLFLLLFIAGSTLLITWWWLLAVHSNRGQQQNNRRKSSCCWEKDSCSCGGRSGSMDQEMRRRQPPRQVNAWKRLLINEGLPELPTEAYTVIEGIWNTPSDSLTLDEKCNYDGSASSCTLALRDMLTLKPAEWLNDEVINHYMGLIMQRNNRASSHLPRVFAFNTFFMKRLRQGAGNYDEVRRWTKNLDLFAHDIVIVPVHQYEAHWALVVVDFRDWRIDFYDSYGSDEKEDSKIIKAYLETEAQEKKRPDMLKVAQQLGVHTKEGIPYQQNGSDCGVFMCAFAEYASRRANIDFRQSHMSYFRRRMAWEIYTGTLIV